MRLRHLAAACAVAALAVVPAAPASAAADCSGLPKHSNFPVVDAANRVPPEAEAYLIADLMQFQITGDETIVAVTVPTLGGDDVSSYARRLFDCWGIGDADSDAGVLILVAIREQRVRIEAGAGLEDRLAEEDLEAALDTMVAPLRRGDVGGGLRAAAVTIADQLGRELPDVRNNPGALPPGVPRVPTPPRATASPRAPGDVDDTPDTPDGADPSFAPAIPDIPSGASPYRVGGDGPGIGFFGLIPVIAFLAIVGGVLRRVFSGVSGLTGGGGSSWRGGFGGGMWGGPALFRHGGWTSGDPNDSGSSPWSSFGGSSGGSSFGGSSFGSSGSFGGGSGGGGSSGGGSSGGGGSFGGGSSGGGGASGSW